jgi:dGTPase
VGRPITAPPADPTVLLGRRYTSKTPQSRTETGRDRDRILYSSAFLRLGSVTQVASPEGGHTFHSRLTHSLKVAQVARRLAERLNQLQYTGAAADAVAALDPDATEACALAHDLGHPPFGHLAEQELNTKAASFGGFEGNAQSFRILTRLAVHTLEHPGLNLTRQTLNGVLKYPWSQHPDEEGHDEKWGVYDADRKDFEWTRQYCEGSDEPSLEARVMDWADDLTYAVHDLDDFFRAGLIPLDSLCRGEDELLRFREYVAAKEPEVVDTVTPLFAGLGITTRYEGRVDERAQLRGIGSLLITRYINAFSVVNNDNGGAAVEVNEEYASQVKVLKKLIWFYIIERPSLAVLQAGQRRMIRDLVDLFMQAVDDDKRRPLLGPVYEERLDGAETNSARRRVVIDLVAGMTEESAVEVYRRATGVAAGSVLSAPNL